MAAFSDSNTQIQAKALDRFITFKALDKLKDQVPRIVALLSDEDHFVRRSAASALREMGEAAKDQVPKIAALLNDKDQNVRMSAIRALGEMGDVAKSEIPKIAALLNDKDQNVRMSAIRALGKLGDVAKSEIPKIVALLNDEDLRVRLLVIEVLGEMRDVAKAEIPKIAALLNDENQYVRLLVIEVLGEMGDVAKSEIPKIAALLNDEDQNVRMSAIGALGEMGDVAKSEIPKIAALLNDKDQNVRMSAIGALGKLGEISKVVALLNDENSFIRGSAVGVLGGMGEAAKSEIPKIAALLNDKDQNVRMSAIGALGKLGEISRVVALLNDKNPFIRGSAVGVLGGMGEAAKSEIPKIAALLNDENRNVRMSATFALVGMGDVAKNEIPKIAALLDDKDAGVRMSAIRALGEMGDVAKSEIAKTAALLDDKDLGISSSAIYALGQMGEAAKAEIPKIAAFLNDKKRFVRTSAIMALEHMGQLEAKIILHLLDAIYTDLSLFSEFRFGAHYLGGGEEDSEILIKWLGKSDYIPPDHINYSEGLKTLKIFEVAWQESAELPDLHADLATQTAVLAKRVNWQPEDLPLLRVLVSKFKKEKSIPQVSQAAVSLQNTIKSHEKDKKVLMISRIWLAHASFWIFLIVLYPRSPQIQAIFFWNPWVRRLIGFGYIGFALTWVPFFRLKLFSPFKESLLSDAAIENLDQQIYFEDSEIKNKLTGETQATREAIPKIHKQIILEGESGLGKTMFLRHLVKSSKQITVFLPAKKCDNGVIEAIQAKLHGPARDPKFLRNLIFCGAINICIDGLNEVTAETRAKITEFVENYFKGNIIMTTQPLEWTPPKIATTYILQALTKDKIEGFLVTRKEIFHDHDRLSDSKYEEACTRYISSALHENQAEEALTSTYRILSNPMDLTVVAQILAQGEKPDIFHLLEQQYDIMTEDYSRVNLNEKFPLEAFSEAVYRMKLDDEGDLPEKDYLKELQCMERHKMVVTRQALDAEGRPTKEWHFRHDKIMEFFVVQTFLGPENERPQEHLSDPRFRGVYFLLAILMSFEEAQKLREHLIQYAADTKDHTLSDSFIQLLRSRKAA